MMTFGTYHKHVSKTLRAIVYGAAVGDALGVPCECMERGAFACEGMVGGGAHGMPTGMFSDDTSLLLATCDGRVRVEDTLICMVNSSFM